MAAESDAAVGVAGPPVSLSSPDADGADGWLARGVVEHDRSWPLTQEWELAQVPCDAPATPEVTLDPGLRWAPAPVPGTVAMALRLARGHAPEKLDEQVWWFRCRFETPPGIAARRLWLELAGLATVATVWLNGRELLRSDNMFVEHRIDVTDLLRDDNELLLRFGALDERVSDRRSRPRWRTPFVTDNRLRWIRTTLLGRTPGWTPPTPPVGPWRTVRLLEQRRVDVQELQVEPSMRGGEGILRLRARLALLSPGEDASPPQVVAARLKVGGHHREAHWQATNRAGGALAELQVSGELHLPNVRRWWPHTHGDQPLYPVELHLDLVDPKGTVGSIRIGGGRVGFHDLRFDVSDDGSGFRMGDTPIFCRGACWTPLDMQALHVEPARYRQALELARKAGMNMLRIAGTMCYEADAFFDLCDELGILVWQDFMFARLDYPHTDLTLLDSVRREAEQLLRRIGHRPCLALLCGNSEVEQQAAMWGLRRGDWRSALFGEHLPAWCAEHCPRVPYQPSSPSGGALPFDNRHGIAHYFGVGGYLRPLEDARRSEVGFASECLAFANVPEKGSLDRWLDRGQSPPHHPDWKARVPRDMGVGWDFDDVRDHYLKHLFGVDPVALRSHDVERYLALSRIVTGEAMAAVFAEWRRSGSTCGGGLVWLWQDVWPGPGWGVVDAEGLPKAAYFYLKRALAPVAVFLSDEGLDGLAVHMINERSRPLPVQVTLRIFRDAQLLIAADRNVELAPRSVISQAASQWLDRFVDLNHAYRFGPAGHDLVSVSLVDRESGTLLHEALYFPQGFPLRPQAELGLRAVAAPGDDGTAHLHLHSERLAYAVAIELPGYVPDDNYLHIPPGCSRQVCLRPVATLRPTAGRVRAINGCAAASVTWSSCIPSMP